MVKTTIASALLFVLCVGSAFSQTAEEKLKEAEANSARIREQLRVSEQRYLLATLATVKMNLDLGDKDKALEQLRKADETISGNEKSGLVNVNQSERQQIKDLISKNFPDYHRDLPDAQARCIGFWMETWKEGGKDVRYVRYISSDGFAYCGKEKARLFVKEGRLFSENDDGWVNEYSLLPDETGLTVRHWAPGRIKDFKALPLDDGRGSSVKVGEELKPAKKP